jgi:SnoaL-like domain
MSGPRVTLHYMDREKAIAFVEGYGRTWQAWDYEGFADLFTEDAIYVEHPTDETVVGRGQLLDYIRREHAAEGVASVSMGIPVVEGEHVIGEFWTTMSKPGEIATLIGCFIAKAR